MISIENGPGQYGGAEEKGTPSKEKPAPESKSPKLGTPKFKNKIGGYKLIENYKKSLRLQKEASSEKQGQIKKMYKQTAGFPSMLDSGIQGIN